MPAQPAVTAVALVTGAAGRIGAVIARRLSTAGYAVVIHYRSGGDDAKRLAAEIKSAGGKAATLKADLASRSQRAALIAKAAKPFGPLTLLVNNASIFVADSLTDLDESLWDAHFAIHAEAPVFLARDFAAQLPHGATGNIINIIDERVLHPSPAYFSYALSKSTLLAANTALAQQLAPRIRVNAIAPGLTIPAAGVTEDAFRKAEARLPLQRAATPADIAESIVFLLNNPAMSGQVLALDGGQHIEWTERRGPTPRK